MRHLEIYCNSWLNPRGGGYSHIWAIRGCAAQQGMVFASLSLEQGLQIRAFLVWNRVYFLPCDSGTQLGLLFCCQNRTANERCCVPARCPTACLLKHAVSDLKVNCVSHFFSLEQGIYFHHFVWNRVAKLCLFSPPPPPCVFG